MESRAEPLGALAPNKTAAGLPPGQVPDVATPADPTQGEETTAEQQAEQPTDLVPNWVTPDSTEGVLPQPPAKAINPGADTTTPTLGTKNIAVPPGFWQQLVALVLSLAQAVLSDVNPDEGGLQAQVTTMSLASLTQFLAITQAGGDPNTGSLPSVMVRLRETCGLMTQGFHQAGLDVEVVVRKMIQDAMAHDWALTTKATQDLDLWTSALWPILDSEGVSEADMAEQVAYARKTGQMISNWILGLSQDFSAPWHPDLGHTGIVNPTIRSSDYRAKFPDSS